MNIIYRNKIIKILNRIANSEEIKNYKYEENMKKKYDKKKFISEVFSIPINKVDLEPDYFFDCLNKDRIMIYELKKVLETMKQKSLAKNRDVNIKNSY